MPKFYQFTRSVDRSFRRFAQDKRGGIAVTFGLAFVPVAFLSLVMIDYARASTAKQHLQEAVDAATLIAARSSFVDQPNIDATGDKALTAQLSTKYGINGLTADGGGHIAGSTFAPNGNIITSTVTATIDPIVANLFIGGPMTIHANSEVVRSVNKLEIAMVLDTTGSMSGTKIANLITAAKNFVTTMEAAASRSTEVNPVKISLVPFSTTVKVSAPISLATYNTTSFTMTGLPTWLDGRARGYVAANDIFATASTDRFKMLKQMNISWGGCVEARVAPYDVQEDAPTSGTVGTLFTPFFWPDEPDQLDNGSADNTPVYKNDYLTDGVSGNNNWKARERAVAKYNTTSFKSGTPATFSQGSGYGAALTSGPNAGCAMQQLQRLTTNFNGLRTAIDGLVASGETNIPLGMAWGWHTLSPNGPFADGVAYLTPKTSKIIVLMTDGDNTMNALSNSNLNDSWYHGYGYQWQDHLSTGGGGASTRTAKLDARFTQICTNIKAKQIMIYTVGVGVSASAKTLLQGCADTPSQYYDVDATASNLDGAFSAIAGTIENLRISH